MYHIETLYHTGLLENSIHFIFDEKSKTCAIIDPAWEADLFLEKITQKGYKLTDIWLTHWHNDHTNAVDALVKATNAKVSVGINELPYLTLNSPLNTLQENDKLTLGDTQARVLNTPGHSAGGVCFILDKHIIAGDTLFVYGAGHCSLPGGSIQAFFHSMQILAQVDKHLLLKCGHDYGNKPTTTMGEQQAGNAFLLIDNQADFVRYVEGMGAGIYPYPTHPISKTELDIMLS
jgi:glyoxylase-like metal-dependent hydrolase (beta-lactamase superfamily II)